MSTILVVDDSRFSRRMIVDALRSAGHAVVEATDGEEALQSLGQQPFDCMVTDLLMPRMNGVELLRKVRCDGNTIPVIVCSADIQHSTRTECEQLGIVGFMGKPFKGQEFLECVARGLIPGEPVCN